MGVIHVTVWGDQRVSYVGLINTGTARGKHVGMLNWVNTDNCMGHTGRVVIRDNTGYCNGANS
jgi:hypothetical protein